MRLSLSSLLFWREICQIGLYWDLAQKLWVTPIGDPQCPAPECHLAGRSVSVVAVSILNVL